MKRALVAVVLAVFLAPLAMAQRKPGLPRPTRPVHTFSIVARDPRTGEMGAAVQSHWFAVGSNVIWAEAGVGAVATQSFVDPSYGPLGLTLMRAGKSAPDALKALLAGDAGRAVRQVAFVDASGTVATWTGAGDIPSAGGVAGNRSDGWQDDCGGAGATRSVDNGLPFVHPCGGRGAVGHEFAAQANLMANDTIWPAMAKAYQASTGDLAERLLAALEAGQAAGGDIRGRQSAAIIVVKGTSTGKPWQDAVFNLRVDDAAEPIPELRRLVTLQRAYNRMNAGDLAVEHGDNEGALREYLGRRGDRVEDDRRFAEPAGRDDLLARGRAGDHEPRGRVAAALQARVRDGEGLGGADAAAAEGGAAAGRRGAHRQDHGAGKTVGAPCAPSAPLCTA